MKIKTFVLALLSVVALAACGEKKEAENAAAADASPVAATAPVIDYEAPSVPEVSVPADGVIDGEIDTQEEKEAILDNAAAADEAVVEGTVEEEDVTPAEEEIVPSDESDASVPDAATVEEAEEGEEIIKDETVEQ